MPRLPLVLCVLALLASALSTLLYFRSGNAKQVLEQRLADVTTRATQLDADLASANELSGSLKAQRDAQRSDLTDLKTRLIGIERQSETLERELQSARHDLSAARDVVGIYEVTARALADEIAALREDLAASRASHASPEAVAAYKATIAELERQLASTRDRAIAIATPSGSTAVFASRAGRATVLTVGPQNAFVVLNFGEARGAQLGQKLVVSQGTNEVAMVLISDVRTNVSIAQVLPDTLRGVLQKGDLAVLIR